ncbi:Imm1 family immunity protein [Motilibacter deserti]|uniref:Immunity protein Imm1 n=1 Tax=Motilibacter deserti TaxID=2714956 RepID=A0ABX0GZN5_9ACTN|nr:hypothetical protein [Motilibacter deserti]
MFVTSVASAIRGSAVEREWEPDWDEGTVRQLVEALDGIDTTAVVFAGPDEAHLAVGGSAYAGLVVYVSYAGGEAYSLADPAAPEGTATVVTAGTPGDYELRYVVGPDAAVQAAWRFVRHGDLDDALEWETG